MRRLEDIVHLIVGVLICGLLATMIGAGVLGLVILTRHLL